MKKRSDNEYGKILYSLTVQKKGRELSSALEVYTNFLIKERVLRRIDVIIEKFLDVARVRSGAQTVTLTTARELTNKTKKIIEDIIGKHNEFREVVDPSVLGGIRLRIDNTIYDATIATNLKRLKHTIL